VVAEFAVLKDEIHFVFIQFDAVLKGFDLESKDIARVADYLSTLL